MQLLQKTIIFNEDNQNIANGEKDNEDPVVLFKENVARYAVKFIGTKIGEQNDLNLDTTVKRAVEGLSAGNVEKGMRREVQRKAKRYTHAVN